MPFRLSASAVQRILRSLLVAELAAGGRKLGVAEAATWPDDLSLAEDGLALDSLELLACAGAVNQLFQLHETGIEDYLLSERRLDAWGTIVAAGLQEGVSGFTFATSGSTGAPKRCGHSLAVLEAETAFWTARYAGVGRIVQAVPAHHIYGCLFVGLLPDRLGVPVLDARPMPPGKLALTLRADDLLVGFPAGHAQMLRSLPALPPGIRCVSSTGPLPAATQLALRDAGAAEVTEVYGSSETAGLAFRTNPMAPFRLLPRWRPGQAGDDASVIECVTGAEVSLPDRAEWDAAGALWLRGRKDHAVQVGGVNVFPARIAARLAEHPLVTQCAVRLDETLPEPRLKAFIVTAAGHPVNAVVAVLDAWCRQNFSAAERPVRFDCGDALPQSELGKLADWQHAA